MTRRIAHGVPDGSALIRENLAHSARIGQQPVDLSGESFALVGAIPQFASGTLVRLEAELLDAVADLVAMQTEQGSGSRLVSPGPFERQNDQPAFDIFNVQPVLRKHDACAACRARFPASIPAERVH